MRRLTWMPLGLLVVLLGAGLAVHRVSAVRVRDGFRKDLEAAKALVVARSPLPQNPRHENGFECLGSMIDVTPRDLSPFETARADASLTPFLTGDSPMSALPGEVRGKLDALGPWAQGLRECADSQHLSFVGGLSPWSTESAPRWSRLRFTTAALFLITNLEVRTLLAEGKPEPALDRCGLTLAFAADLSHLGPQGALLTRLGLRALAPVCGGAFAQVPPEVKTGLAKDWAALPARLARAQDVVAAERISMGMAAFGWSMDVPLASPVADPSLLRRLLLQRLWASWDGAMRKLEAVADVPGPARLEAAQAVDDTFHAWWLPADYRDAGANYGQLLASVDENDELLTLLLALALNDTSARPHVTRTDTAVTFTPSSGDPLVISTVK